MSEKAAGRRATEVRRQAVEQLPHHRRLLESAADGARLSAIMLPTFAVAAPPGHGVLTTIGRKSGQPRQKVIRVIRRGDKAFVVMLRPPALARERPDAVSAWMLNIRSDPRVTLRLGRRTFNGVAREIDAPAELESAREAICETVHIVDYGECLLHLRGLPTRSKIKDLHRYWFETGVPVAVDLDQSR